MQVSLDDYSWAAGVATELVNTAPGVWNGVDKLPDLTALETFLVDHRLPTAPRGEPGSAPAARDLEQVHELRTQLRAIIETTDPALLIERASALSTAAGGLGLLLADDERRRWQIATRPGTSLAEQLALVAAVGILGVVRVLGVDRFRQCAAPTCSGVFIDTTRPGRRRYCMPGICGNRVNVANHRARARQDAAGTLP